jgi:hypothetical protein
MNPTNDQNQQRDNESHRSHSQRTACEKNEPKLMTEVTTGQIPFL